MRIPILLSKSMLPIVSYRLAKRFSAPCALNSRSAANSMLKNSVPQMLPIVLVLDLPESVETLPTFSHEIAPENDRIRKSERDGRRILRRHSADLDCQEAIREGGSKVPSPNYHTPHHPLGVSCSWSPTSVPSMCVYPQKLEAWRTPHSSLSGGCRVLSLGQSQREGLLGANVVVASHPPSLTTRSYRHIPTPN